MPTSTESGPTGHDPATQGGGWASVFVLGVLVVPVVWVLISGHFLLPPSSWPSAPKAQPGELAPSAPLPELDEAAQRHLMALVFDTLRSLALGADAAPAEQPVPEPCRRPTDAAVFVTAYGPGGRPLRAWARAGSLAASTREAAGRLLPRRDGPPTEEQAARLEQRLRGLRVRVEIIAEQAELSPSDRALVAAASGGEPFGAAVVSGAQVRVFAPGDMAGRRANDHRDAFEALCREVGEEGDAWSSRRLRLSLLRSVSLINAAPGSTHALSAPRGLPVVQGVGPSLIEGACRQAADHLAGRWFLAGGRPPAEVLEVTGALELDTGPATARQARAAAAVARVCKWDPDPDRLAVCRIAAAWAAGRTKLVEGRPRAAFAAPDGPTDAPRLADATAVLDLLCAVREATGEGTTDAIIRSLGAFILLLQREDGGFAESLPSQGEAPRAAPSDEADAARALLLTGAALDAADFQLAAQIALLRLARSGDAVQDAGAARRFLVAAALYSAHLPPGPLMPRAGEAVGLLERRQLTGDDAPAPDLAGGCGGGLPPSTAETGGDLEAFAAGWLVAAASGDRELAARCRRAALGAARYVVQFQYTSLTSYYLRSPVAALGGVRTRPGANTVAVESTGRALAGLDALRAVLSPARAPEETP